MSALCARNGASPVRSLGCSGSAGAPWSTEAQVPPILIESVSRSKLTTGESGRRAMDGVTQIFRELLPAKGRTARNRDGELVTAIAAGHRAGRQSLANDVTDGAHRLGAGGVPYWSFSSFRRSTSSTAISWEYVLARRAHHRGEADLE